jgi:lysozyme
MVRFNDPPKPPPRIVPMADPPGKATLYKKLGTTAAVAALALVAAWEGKRNDPYFDIVHVQTVCYGETNVAMRHYSDAECQDMLAKSLGSYGDAVLKRNPGLRARPYQLAAAVSLSYNIGPAAYAKSTVAKRFDARDWRGGCDAFLAWRFAGGKPVQGLLNRRNAERSLCMKGLPQ